MAATVAESVLALGQSVVIDAVNGVGEAERWWRDLADRSCVPLVVIETICSDPQLDAVAPVADNLAQALEWVRRAGHNETPKGTSGP
ncbi:MAG TPA: hypothetical protein VFO73_01540 [Candidatus Limnocylindrales bacterium]|nr:hypothetical protein [Candidatus Limnocylindrales bacterium]